MNILSASPNHRIYKRVVLFSFTLFITEFLLFKIAYYVTDYTNSVLIVSYALIGIGLGGLLSAYWRGPQEHRFLISLLGTWIGCLISAIKLIKFPGSDLSSVLISSAFFFPGYYLSNAFNEYPSPRVYFADLFGASLAVVSLLLFYSFLLTETLFLESLCLISGIGIWNAFKVGSKASKYWIMAFGILAPFSLFLLIHQFYTDSLNLFRITPQVKGITDNKVFGKGDRLIKSYDNLINRVDVIQDKKNEKEKKYIVAFGGYINDHFDRSGAKAFKNDIRIISTLVDQPKIFIVGTSAQGIVKVALAMTNKKNIYGAEINPAIYKMMTKDFVKESRNPYKGIDIKIGNALAVLNSRGIPSEFDILTLINSHSMPKISNLGPPDFLHTRESYQFYLNRLTDRGFLMLEERPISLRGEYGVYRIIATLYDVLKQAGNKQPEKNFFVYSWRRRGFQRRYAKHTLTSFTSILVKKTAITEEDKKRILKWWYNRHPKNFLFSEDISAEQIVRSDRKSRVKFNYLSGFLEGDDYKKLFHSLSKGTVSIDYPELDLTPITKNRPYSSQVYRNYPELAEILQRLGVLVFGVLIFILLLSARTTKEKSKDLILNSYQILVGFAYILIEILLLQFYQYHFLSAPISFVAILATMLISSAVGGLVLHQIKLSGLAMFALAACLLLDLSIYFHFLDLLPFSAIKILVILICVSLTGFFMGYFFPKGLSLAKSAGIDNHAPHYFAINSLAGTLATPACLYLSARWGVLFAFTIGFACYALAWLLMELVKVRER